MIRLGKKLVKPLPAMVRGLRLYAALFLKAGIVFGVYSAQTNAQAPLPVPCGGGCVANGGPAVWVSSGQVQTPSITGNTMTITQQSNTATLNWASFDVGTGATVDFSQPSSSSVALNRIYEGNASQIQGAIHANGQIYLINQNGIVFGAGAQVDVHGLVASTLDVTDQIFNSVGIAQAITQSAAAFSGSGPMGNITINPGAVIKTDDGGQVMIFAPTITNGGTISTPQGQTILAASQDNVYLKVNSPTNPGLRGFLVEVGSGGTVTNSGDINVGEGNATLMGHIVNQDGTISATTSLQLNGSIMLLARDQVNLSDLSQYANNSLQQIATRGGSVTLGKNSVTEVLPATGDTATAVNSQTQLPSQVEVMGETIDMQTASKIIAPGGQVSLTATEDPNATTELANDSRILMEAQSLIDVSGTTSTVLPMDSNIVQVQLNGIQLADSPLQRDGILYGKTVNVDISQGTPLADVSGSIANVQYSVDQRLSVGGTVSMSSEGDFILSQGAAVNVSGGEVTYQSGYLDTTKLVTSTGQVVDIGNADPNQQYVAIFGSYSVTDPKWGVTQSWQSPVASALATYQPGYVQGMDAGSLSIVAPGVVLDGNVYANTIDGPLQRLPTTPLASGEPAWARPGDEVPLGGALTLGDVSQVNSGSANPDFVTPAVLFTANDKEASPITIDSPSTAGQTVDLSTALLADSGIDRLAVYSSSSITVPASVSLSLAPGGTLTLESAGAATDASGAMASSLSLNGNVTIPGGQVNLTSIFQPPINGGSSTTYQAIEIGHDAKIDLAGMWVNDSSLLNPAGATGPVVINGGALTLSGLGNVSLDPGSIVDVSGGAQLTAGGKVVAGSGGDIILSSNNGNSISDLVLDGELLGDSLSKGGTLAIKADGVAIQPATVTVQAQNGVLDLTPSFFANSGFENYNITATGLGLNIADNTQLNLVAQNRVLNSGYTTVPTGASLNTISNLAVLPQPQRSPVNLTLTSTRNSGSDPGGMTLGTGAVIQADPQASVTLNSDRMITVEGTIDAPAGDITLSLTSNLSIDGFLPDKAIWLTPGSQLLAPAYVQLLPNDLGYQVGQVLGAGTVKLNALDGFIIAASGSRVNVSGVAQTLDVLTDVGSTTAYVPQSDVGAAGAINLQAADGMYLDGDLSALAAPVAGAAGGSLSVSLIETGLRSGYTISPGQYYFPTGQRIIQLTDSTDPSLPQGITVGDALLSSSQLQQLQSSVSNSVTAVADVSTRRIEQGGFASVNFSVQPVNLAVDTQTTDSASIAFSGNVTLTAQQQITLDTPVLSTQGGNVQLTAPYVAIGPSDTAYRLNGTATAGSATLNVTADLIDLIGDTSLQGFGAGDTPAVNLLAADDIRLQGIRTTSTTDVSGSFTAAGNMAFTAGQIYPTTLTDFTITLQPDAQAPQPNTQGTIRFASTGSGTQTPLSADGILTVSAPNIDQEGILRAPFGQISLNASESLKLDAGSVTSVSGANLIVPFGQTQFDQDWIIPYLAAQSESTTPISVVDPSQTNPYNLSLPTKQVTLNSPSVNFAKGASIDVAGGGDLYAFEFVPGIGGSTDVLQPNVTGAFAVVPTLGSLYAPVDPTISSQGLQVGETVYLGAANGLAAGTYAVLPARYALLPGTYLVTPVAGTDGMNPGQVNNQLSGIPIVAGQQRIANTAIAGVQWSGYAIENGAQVRQQAQYTESYASSFFNAASAPQMPVDAGDVIINAQTTLNLGGTVDGQSPGGRGSQVDITGQQLSVVSQTSADATGIQILADGLNDLGASSVLLGGTRQITADGIVLNATAQSIDIGSGVDLQMPELMLVAASSTEDQGNVVPGQINVASGAILDGTGKLSGEATTLLLTGDTALLRVAAAGTPDIQHSDVPNTPIAQLSIAAGAQLIAGNSGTGGVLQGGTLNLDSTGDAVSSGTIHLGDGGALSLGASRIAVGDATGVADNQGLVLSNEALSTINVSNLSLASASGIDFYGNPTLSASNITLQAQSLNGYGAAGQVANVNATTSVSLIGDTSASSPGGGNGAGNLAITAPTINVGTVGTASNNAIQSLSVNGFDEVDLTANTSLAFKNTGNFNVSGAATITAGEITGSSASSWNVSVAGILTIAGNGQTAPTPTTTSLGAVLALSGEQVSIEGTNIVLPSGSLSLTANGIAQGDDVVVGPQTLIDVSGRSVTFATTTESSPGGTVTLQSQASDVQIQSGATIKVAGGTDAAGAGTVAISAPQGAVTIADNSLIADQNAGADARGNFSVDAVSVPDLSTLFDPQGQGSLSQNGFTGNVAIRARSGDLALGTSDQIIAQDVTLTADNGNIDIAGLINASGTTGGQVTINAADNLTLESTAQILARATGVNTQGGTVLLGTTQGGITFNQGALIDVTGTEPVDLSIQQQGVDANGQSVTNTVTRTGSGTVTFSLPRSNVAASDLSGAVTGIVGAGSVIVKANQVYIDSTGTLGGNDAVASASNPYYEDAVTFMQNEPTIMANLGLASDPSIQLRPGIEIDSQGPLTITSDIDLSQWRFGPQGAPGVLTLRSTGNLAVNGDISDGFSENVPNPYTGTPEDVLRQDDSWSLALVAGADLTSADPLAVTPGLGNLTLGNGVRVRTGTGSIDIDTGGELTLTTDAVIYSAGVDGGLGTFDPLFDTAFLGGQYPLGGGDVRVDVGGDIVGLQGQATTQLVNAWLPQVGGNVGDFGVLPTAWAIDVQNFQQGIGALGGGNVSVAASGDISDLQVVMPTVGMQTGQAVYDSSNGLVSTTVTNQIAVTGGINLDVTAGGNILGGMFLAGQGVADIRAGGAIGASRQTSLFPFLELGDAQFNVEATKNLGIETALNPSMLPTSPDQGVVGVFQSFFFTYGANSAVNLTSLSGDVSLNGNASEFQSLFPNYSDPVTASQLLTVLPGNLSAVALQGSIDPGSGQFTLFPTARGQLALLADDSVQVQGNNSVIFDLSDANPNNFPSPLQPSNSSPADLVSIYTNVGAAPSLIHAAQPMHSGDPSPALIVANDGSIGSEPGTLGSIQFNLAKSVWLSAGQDIRNTNVVAQNVSPDDVSLIQAGGDITFDTTRTASGVFAPSAVAQITIDGPGNLDVLAGGTVDMGTSQGIVTRGNTQNPALAPSGANVTVVAGLGTTVDFSAFITKYLTDSTAYQAQLLAFLSNYPEVDPTLSPVKQFQALPLDVQSQFIFSVFFSELQTSGVTAANSPNKDYSRGFNAINTLFPGSLDGTGGVIGSLEMLLSRIATLDGGNITLVVPRGDIDAGVTDTSVIAKDPGQLGIVVQNAGSIDAYVRGDFEVNQSRVFALNGGDILIWSSLGNIDAGLGAKTAIFAPGVQTTVDAQGNLILVFPPAIAGSGIQAAVSSPDTPPGNIFLFAPQGIVNAGDAGISSQGNLTIAAAGVVNATNISVGGVSVGVPVVNTSSLAAGLTGIGNVASDVTKSTADSLSNAANSETANTPLADAALAYLDVVVFGLGSEAVGGDSLGNKANGN